MKQHDRAYTGSELIFLTNKQFDSGNVTMSAQYYIYIFILRYLKMHRKKMCLNFHTHILVMGLEFQHP